MLFSAEKVADVPQPAVDTAKAYLVQFENGESLMLEQFYSDSDGVIYLKVDKSSATNQHFAMIYKHTTWYANHRQCGVRRLLDVSRDHEFTEDEMRDRYIVITVGTTSELPDVLAPPRLLSFGYHFNFGVSGLGQRTIKNEVSHAFGVISGFTTLNRTN